MLESEQKFNIRNDKKYKIEVIYDNKIYIKEVIKQLLRLYYLVFLKNYLKDKNI